ncbi:MAG: 3-dehydroquinate dehydratase [Bacteroidales bacterium]|nr:3-dehydroquinate dehydratase [Bacteroidales bacterium]MDD4217534.1 3-dehydroquinate dehydratase [Bacteroidales bacterium]MDY0142214.1 type II 3-dehydroquinate dehydratase [Bacteroidales bacterium]
MRLIIINGPNLHNIGKREPEVYGNISLDDYFNNLKTFFHNMDLSFVNSHFESEIVSVLYDIENQVDGIILNAGAYSHTSVAIRDAISAISVPVVMVHISNVYARESFRNNNMIAPVCKGIITGFGVKSYKIAIQSFVD